MDTLNTVFETLSSVLGISLERVVLGNTILGYLDAFLFFIGFIILFKFIQFLILHRLSALAKRTKTDADDTLIRIVEGIRPTFYSFLAFYFAVLTLTLNLWVEKTLTALLLFFVVYQAVKAMVVLVDYLGEKWIQRRTSEEGDVDAGAKAAVGLIRTLTKATLWVLGALLILSNLGVEITSLIAGLGIGGIAIAFALQAVLGDLFSSFTIYFDRPFKVGDFIVVGDIAATVERVGIKTTRLRALQGEEIVMSNSDLTSSRISNYKHMDKRRIVLTFGVLYETPIEKLKEIPSMVKGIFASIPNAEFARAHFKEFADSSLVFEVVYHVLSGDYNEYMDIQQSINITIMELFEKNGITFAYPTQTIYLSK